MTATAQQTPTLAAAHSLVTRFELEVSPDELQERLAAAAAAEYTAWLEGAAPLTVRAQREHRLRLLQQHVWKQRPTILQVAQVFRLTIAEARSLLRTTAAREVDGMTTLKDSVADAIKRATEKDESIKFWATRDQVDYCRALIESTGKALPPIRSHPEEQSAWVTAPATVALLRDLLGLPSPQ